MAKLDRKTQKIFGASSPASEITAFATTLEDNPTFTKDIDEIQNTAFEEGWFEETDNGNQRPFAEDRNSVDYTVTRQLAYILQAGLAEWDAGTDYHLNGLVRVDNQLYISLQNNNINNNPVSSPNWWRPYTIDSEDAGMVGEIKMYAGTILPSAKWQFCRGQELSKADYALLYSRIGDAYGIASVNTNFKLPNLYSRIPIGIAMSGDMANVGYQFGSLNHTHIQQAHKHTNLSGLAIGVAGGGHTHTITDNGHWHEMHYKNTPPNASARAYVSAYCNGTEAGKRTNSDGMGMCIKATTDIKINSANHTHNAGSFTGWVGNPSAQNNDNNLNTGANNPPCICMNFIIKVSR